MDSTAIAIRYIDHDTRGVATNVGCHSLRNTRRNRAISRPVADALRATLEDEAASFAETPNVVGASGDIFPGERWWSGVPVYESHDAAEVPDSGRESAKYRSLDWRQ